MVDILLDSSGDLLLNEQGDITLTESVAQKIVIRLKWFAAEWRWNRDEGLPYFESLLIKNPDIDSMEAAIRRKIFEVPEVTDVRNVSITFSSKSRTGIIRFVALTDQETIKEEVKIQWQITE